MAVTILQRPEGHVLDDGSAGSISSSYGTGDATVYSISPHGLSDGDYVYIESYIEDYNGFWLVDVTGTYTFKVKRYDADTFLQYINDSDLTYFKSISDHGWSAVHLPIVYKLLSDKYPVNSVNPIRTVTSFSDDDGYTVLNISGSLGDVKQYNSVSLVAPNQSDIEGVYQIVDWISSTVVVVNLTYSEDYDLSSATVQKYYSEYNVLVRVYAGLNPSHPWASRKPYELISTLTVIPDSNNEIKISVNDIVKSKVKTENNLLLATLPNNIDQHTQFYIEYAETYTESDGYSIGSYTSPFISDQGEFEGYAVNAKLPFKNVHSGYMSDYLMGNDSGKFLTLFETPVLFGCSENYPDCYNEVTFIKADDRPLILQLVYYLNGVQQTTETQTVAEGTGVFRVPVTVNCDYDRVDISLQISETSIMTGTGGAQYEGYAPSFSRMMTLIAGAGDGVYTGYAPTASI